MKNHTVKTLVSSIAVSLALLTAGSAQAGPWTGNTSLVIGEKTLDEKDWGQHEEQDSIGLMTDFKEASWPVSVAVDIFGTGREKKSGGDKHEAYTAEAHIGLRKIFELPIENCRLRPYLGAGLALIYADEKSRESGVAESDDDSAAGYWLGAGTYFKVTDSVNLGLDVRHSSADVTLAGEERDGGGTMVNFGAGYHW